MTNERPAGPAGTGNGPPTRRVPKSRLSTAEQRRMQEDVREASFPTALRGYDRAAVDRYVKEANRLIAELELSSSPEAAVRHALDEVSEETSGLLQRAYETAEEIAARSRGKADDRLQEAEREAEALREAASREAEETQEAAQREARDLRETVTREAQELRATAKREVEELRAATEARVQDLERNAETLRRERRRLIDDMRAVAQEQLEIADGAMARFPHTEVGPAEPATADETVEEHRGAADKPPAAAPENPEQV